ncbi:hypothetical protein MRX96_006270 [Rhipicephalus microplus]
MSNERTLVTLPQRGWSSLLHDNIQMIRSTTQVAALPSITFLRRQVTGVMSIDNDGASSRSDQEKSSRSRSSKSSCENARSQQEIT